MVGGGMLDRLGIGGGTAGAARAGMTGGPGVEVVGCTGGMGFGRGGMYGASVSPSEAVFPTAGATLSLRGTTGAPETGRGAGTGADELSEFPTGKTAGAASGRGARTGTGGTAGFPIGTLEDVLTPASGLRAGTGVPEIPGGFPAVFPDGSTPTGRLTGSGGGGPRLANAGGRAGGIVDGGGTEVLSESSVSTESCQKSFPKWFTAEALVPGLWSANCLSS